MSDRGVVEGAAAPLDTDAIRIGAEERKSQAERMRDTTRDAASWEDYRRSARYFEDVLALVADREALLEHIRQLENQLQLVARTLEPIAYPGKKLLGGGRAARSGGES